MVPIGSIIIWSGVPQDVPAGWQICNGTNGTPDLRDKFPRAKGPSTSVGDTGGSLTHTHTFTGVEHWHSVNEVDGAITGPGTDIWHAGNDGNETNAETATGTNSNADSLPPWISVLYIQRLS